MKNFFIVTNPDKDPDFCYTKKIEDYLKEKGCISSKSTYLIANEGSSYQYTDPRAVPSDAECILVIGGDGTLIHAAKDLLYNNLPLLGINFGKLGYLAEVEKNNIYESLDRLINDVYQVEKRMMLEGEIIRNEDVIVENVALNDIVINRSGSLSIIEFKISVNGQLLNKYRADGIIISTPTGTTGYNLSAGGPIAQPSSNVIIVTPICAHTLNSRSIVFSEDAKIEIEILAEKNPKNSEKLLAFDGDFETQLETCDKIMIEKAKVYTRIIKLNEMSFLELLGKKMC